MWRYLWQHFLIDTTVLDGIVTDITSLLTSDTHLIEIWPWQWALTKLIYQLVPNFRVIEKDPRMESHLLKFLAQEQILLEDVLSVSPSSLFSEYADVVVVWNLPYYITSPIIRQFFVETSIPRGWVFLIQHEVAAKLASDYHKRSFLWWLVNLRCDVFYSQFVPPEAFNPPPNVDSGVIVITRVLDEALWVRANISLDRLISFLDIVSMYKRKTLGKIFKMRFDDMQAAWFVLPDDLMWKRLEVLTWDEMYRILYS